MIDDFRSSFEDMSVLQLEEFFNPKFAEELKKYINSAENDDHDPSSQSKAHPAHWKIARPPHKHRYAYLQGTEALHKDKTPISRILTDLIHSHAFKKWLALVTGAKTAGLIRQNAIARRFRRGKDYALANPYQGDQPQLEFTISITPSEGWESSADQTDEAPETKVSNGKHTTSNGHHPTFDTTPTNSSNSKGKSRETEKVQVSTASTLEPGGEEVYMAGDDDDDTSVHSKSLPNVGKKADPAVYRSSSGLEDEDDGILFANPAGWNRFSVVLRDRGVLRFVKYVSQAAKGDRWDVKGEVEVGEGAFDGDGEDGGASEDQDEDEDDLEGGEEDEGEEDEEEEDEGEDDEEA
jgi:hypothetical protein